MLQDQKIESEIFFNSSVSQSGNIYEQIFAQQNYKDNAGGFGGDSGAESQQ